MHSLIPMPAFASMQLHTSCIRAHCSARNKTWHTFIFCDWLFVFNARFCRLLRAPLLFFFCGFIGFCSLPSVTRHGGQHPSSWYHLMSYVHPIPLYLTPFHPIPLHSTTSHSDPRLYLAYPSSHQKVASSRVVTWKLSLSRATPWNRIRPG